LGIPDHLFFPPSYKKEGEEGKRGGGKRKEKKNVGAHAAQRNEKQSKGFPPKGKGEKKREGGGKGNRTGLLTA